MCSSLSSSKCRSSSSPSSLLFCGRFDSAIMTPARPPPHSLHSRQCFLRPIETVRQAWHRHFLHPVEAELALTKAGLNSVVKLYHSILSNFFRSPYVFVLSRRVKYFHSPQLPNLGSIARVLNTGRRLADYASLRLRRLGRNAPWPSLSFRFLLAPRPPARCLGRR